MLAIVQSLMHLFYHNYDSVTLPVSLAKTDEKSERRPKQQHPVLQMKPLLPSLAQQILIRTAIITISGPIIYAMFIRRAAWNFSLYFATLLLDVPVSKASYIPPYHYTLILRSLICSILLTTMWEFSNLIFSAYLVKAPLKQGEPLTSDSRDPNASLLNGIKAKREIIRVSTIASFLLINADTA